MAMALAAVSLRHAAHRRPAPGRGGLADRLVPVPDLSGDVLSCAGRKTSGLDADGGASCCLRAVSENTPPCPLRPGVGWAGTGTGKRGRDLRDHSLHAGEVPRCFGIEVCFGVEGREDRREAGNISWSDVYQNIPWAAASPGATDSGGICRWIPMQKISGRTRKRRTN